MPALLPDDDDPVTVRWFAAQVNRRFDQTVYPGCPRGHQGTSMNTWRRKTSPTMIATSL